MVKEGYKFALPPLLLGGVVWLLIGWWVGLALVTLGAFVLYFFRDPERVPPQDPSAVVAPADGRVVEIVDESFEGIPGRRLSIFLSVFDVHVNRAPVAGQIGSIQYHPGRYWGAFRPRASQENEQNVIRIGARQGEVVFKQIAGAIARRVICWKRQGAAVALGERVGMIRFGSRADVWLPLGAQIVARRGQRVKAGESILAKWNSTS